jgi:sensory rhodopsin
MFPTEESKIFFLGFLIMFTFSIWFFIRRKDKKNYTFAFLVTSITALSYLLLTDGTVVSVSEFGVPVYYTRWLFYIGSCSLLMATILKFIKAKKENVVPVIILNSSVMLSGAIAAVVYSPLKWIVFALGTLFFIAQITFLFEGVKRNEKAIIIKYYIFLGWAVFPVVFLIAPEGLNLINNYSAAVYYLVLDIFTKIIFYLHLASRK